MKANTILTCILLLGCAACATSRRPVQYVETRIGTAPSETRTAGLFGKNAEEFGQCLPAVLEPHGMNFWTPQTRDTEQKCIAPYYYLDSLLQGFRNSHWIVGGCTQDYGSMTLMPLAGTLRCSPEARASRIDHAHEVSTPSYYRNRLLDEGITAEMTGRSRAAIFRFTYDNAGNGYLVVNPNSDEGAGYVEVDTAKRQIRGYNPVHRIYQGWGEPAGYAGYFVVQLDRDLAEWGTFAGDSVVAGATVIEKQPGIGAYVRFRVNGTADPVTVRAASSFTDMAGALANLEAEIPHDDFDRTRRELSDIWDCRLGLISVEGGSDKDLTKFYSALYRSSFLPREFSDAEGRYWHGNEPCHQVAWLFNYAGEPWKTQRAVRHIMETEYLGVPDGLSGNDDAGQMSAWYIFAALGFYPVCPATPYYIIGSPSFPRAEIALENGKTFTIIAENASPANIYIQSATLDGTPYDKSYISHDDILVGKTLKFVMGPSPSQWGQTLPPAVL